MKKSAQVAAIGFGLWALASLMGSLVKTGPMSNSCGKSYPIDYVIYTNLFCEIEK